MYRKLGLLTAAALMTLTACTMTAQPDPVQQRTGSFPVTVEHKLGTTEIKTQPKRVVTLGLSDHDAVVALGIKPVGVIDWFKERPWGKWPWLKPGLDTSTPEIVGERDEYATEKIAALKPDLILAHYSGIKKEQYDQLQQIAPVVAQVKGFEDYGAPWQEMAKLTAKALGKSTEMDQLIARLNDKFKAAREKHPEWAGKTAIVAEAYQPGKFSVFAPHDPKVLFLKELGFTFPEELKSTMGTKDVVDFSMEKVDALKADRLIWLTSSPAAKGWVTGERLYQTLDVVKAKHDLFVSYEEPPVGAAMSFNTVLSIPYALENLEKDLAALK